MKATQFAWIYLIEHGFAEVDHSYYGGYKFTDHATTQLIAAGITPNQWDIKQIIQLKNIAIDAIKKIGVNWKKTKAPDSDFVDFFNGTFAKEQHSKETITGVLMLKNGTKQQWICDAIEVTNVFAMMELASEAEIKYKEMFGE